MLSACGASDDFAPSSIRADDVSPTSTSNATVAVAYPRFSDSDPHDWQSDAVGYAVHGTDVSKYLTPVGAGRRVIGGTRLLLHQGDRGQRPRRQTVRRHRRNAGPNPTCRAAPIISTISAARPKTRRAGSSGKQRAARAQRAAASNSTWNGTRASPTCKDELTRRPLRSEIGDLPADGSSATTGKPIIYTSVISSRTTAITTFPRVILLAVQCRGTRTANTPAILHPSGVPRTPASCPAPTGDSDINVFNVKPGRLTEKWLKASTR